MNKDNVVVVLGYDIKNIENVIRLFNRSYAEFSSSWDYILFLDRSEEAEEYKTRITEACPFVSVEIAERNLGNFLAPLKVIEFIFRHNNYNLMLRFDDDIVLSDSFFGVMFRTNNSYMEESLILSSHIHNDPFAANELILDFPCLACHTMKRAYYDKLFTTGWLDFMIWLHDDLGVRAPYGLAWTDLKRKELTSPDQIEFFTNFCKGGSILHQDMMQLLFISLYKIPCLKIALPRAGVLAQTSLHVGEETLKHITKEEDLYHDIDGIPTSWTVSPRACILKDNWL